MQICRLKLLVLKRVKNRLRSKTGQERLSNLCILTIHKETAKTLDLDIIVDKFAAAADRRVQFNYYINSICKNSFKTCNFNLKASINRFKKISNKSFQKKICATDY